MAKQAAGPLLVVAGRIDKICEYLKGPGYITSFIRISPVLLSLIIILGLTKQVAPDCMFGCPESDSRH